ncbi:MAG TPA: GlsB/YeaQ/YmgE family stress response membrane protein [Planctomycetota bacterium]|nr:GlsB/YeaQ/YmgE family stress response membrane protein [Planctomycetota bacterium]
MFVIGWIIAGLIIGALAKLVMPGRDPGGIIVTILLGIAGALLAGWVGQGVGWYRPGEPAGYIASIVGAIVILAVYRALVGRRGTLGPATP